MRTHIGKFEILQVLGKGSMGEVFLARDPMLGREVAIKTILDNNDFGPDAQMRFEREARATAALSHPNIVTVFDFGRDGDFAFLVMEKVQGESLESLLGRKDLSKTELVELVSQACEGLAYAHEQGVVHRDVKPSNILVTRKGRRQLAKLMDFGVALVDRSNLTEKGVWLGTLNYTAPDYLDTGRAHPGTDVFAIGVILYRVITGRRPFQGETPAAVIAALLKKEPEPILPGELEDLPPALLEVVYRALAKAPESRYSDGEALCIALRDALEGPSLQGALPREVLPAARDSAGGTPAVSSEFPSPPVSTVGLPAPPSAPPPSPVAAQGLSGSDLAASGSSHGSSGSGSTPRPPGAPRPLLQGLVVGKGGNCLSLRVALRQAESGARILVLPGHYRESLVVDKEVTFVAPEGPEVTVLESPRGPAIHLEAPRLILEGLGLRTGEGNEDSLLRLATGHTLLKDCQLRAEFSPALEVAPEASCQIVESHLVSEGTHLGRVLGRLELQGGHLEGGRDACLRVEGRGSLQVRGTVLSGGQGETAGLGLHLGEGTHAHLEESTLEHFPLGSVELETGARIELRACRLVGSRFAGLLALDKSQALVENCEFSLHEGAGLHAMGGAQLQVRGGRIHSNPGYGLSLLDRSLASLEGCAISANGWAGLLIHQGATAQLRECKVLDGGSVGIACAAKGKGVLEACEIAGNAQTGARVEPGGSLLLVRCVIHDGRDTGLLLFQDAEATLEQCAVHRNARGGILLAKEAQDPILRGENRIEDTLLRESAEGAPVRLAPIRRR